MTALATGRGRTLALVGVLFCLLVPQIPLPGGGGIALRLAKEAWWLALGGAVLWWIVKVERLPLSSIGLWRPTAASLGWAALLVVLLMATVMLSYAVILPALGIEMNRAVTAKIVALPLWLQALMFVRAGIVEEILYRGYPIARLEGLTGRTWLAALIPGAVFIAAHYPYWGVGQLVPVAFATVILTVFYVWKRDLAACMIAHAATDIIGFALANAQLR